MQTRRDQLQAYRFQNRRALAALVTGEPNVLEAPMRRLTVTTVSGIMIAVLVAAVFALIGLIKPSGGSAWKDAGAIIIDKSSPSIYVLLNDDKLHPVVNYASAVLAVGEKTAPHVEYVDAGDIKSKQRGSTIGINGLPYSLPSAKKLITTPWTVCSRLQPSGSVNLQARVGVYVGSSASSAAVRPNEAVLARSVTGSTSYVLFQGARYPVESGGRVAASLSLQSATPLTVATAFLNGVPAGPALKAPNVTGAGDLITAYTVAGKPARVGQLIDVDDGQADLVALPDGVALLTKLQAALLATLPAGTGGAPMASIPITKSDEVVLADRQSGAPWNAVKAQFDGLPDSLPSFATAPATNGGVCAVYKGSSAAPTFATPPKLLPPYPGSTVVESANSAHGIADDVEIRPGGAAVVRSTDNSTTLSVIAAPGQRFAAASTETLKGFGYGDITPAKIAAQVLALIPKGPAFDPAAALLPPKTG